MHSREERILKAVERLAKLDFFRMNPEALLADLQCLFELYGNSFEEVADNIIKALKDIAQSRVTVSLMKYDLASYSCYHFQSIVAQGQAADMRILFKQAEGGVLEVEMIGNRFFPADIYTRATERIEYYIANFDTTPEDPLGE